jgi:hypothetical protein
MLLRAPPHRLQPSLHHNCVDGLVAITPRCPSCNIWATPSRRPSGAQSDVPSRGHEQLFSICVWLFSRSAFLPLFSFSGLRFTSPFCREIIFAERLSLQRDYLCIFCDLEDFLVLAPLLRFVLFMGVFDFLLRFVWLQFFNFFISLIKFSLLVCWNFWRCLSIGISSVLLFFFALEFLV